MTDAPRPRRSRWFATVTRRTEAGPVKVEHEVEELCELHEIVEDFIADIEQIEIRLARVVYPTPVTEKVEGNELPVATD